MQLDLSNIQDYTISYTSYAGTKISILPKNFIQDIYEKAPNKRKASESLLIREVEQAIEKNKK